MALKACSLAAQGLWMRMLCIAAQHDPTGYVSVNRVGLDPEGIAKIVGVGVDEVRSLIGELSLNGVFSRDQHGAIYNRRMLRDEKKSSIARKNGKLGGNPTLCKNNEISTSDKGRLNGRDKPSDNLKPIPIPILRKKETRASALDEFQQFWDGYGHKVARPKALKAFEKARLKAPIAEILSGVERYHKSRPTWQAIQGPEAWLNGERWNDQPANPSQINGHSVSPEKLANSSTIFVKLDTPQWNAWANFYRKSKGMSPPMNKEGGWWFPTEWPPDNS